MSAPAANAEDTPPPLTASLSCTAITPGVNSVTVTGTATFDPSIANLDVTVEVDTADGAYTGTQSLAASGPFSITVSGIPATTQAQVSTSGTYILDQTPTSADSADNCNTDASVVVTDPPASGGGTTPPPVVNHNKPKHVNTGIETPSAAYQAEQTANLARDGIFGGVIALLIIASIVGVKRRRASSGK